MKNKIIIWWALIFILFWIISVWKYIDSFDVDYVWEDQVWEAQVWEENKYWFIGDNLKTNTQKSSIDLDFVLDGGPWKDGIPAINNPIFINISEQDTQEWLKEDTLWISVSIWEESKFYPYSILYWHEIVNDIVWDKKISSTFCPLCWTAIVYNREINWEEVLFGVSGKLYESNLLMFDNINESLWSQSIWEALVWDDLWEKLEIIKSDLLSFSQFKENHPNWLVLSENTWYSRNYSRTPYWSYETVEELYFPVKNTDAKLHQKELMFVIPYDWESYAFVRSELINIWELEYNIWKEKLIIIFKNWELTARIWDKIIPGYIEMWFSWFTQHPESENIWTGK
jgi:hypothetical protein